MDKDSRLDSTRKVVALIAAPLLLLVALLAILPSAVASSDPVWVQALTKKMSALESLYPGQVGVYVKELGSGQEFSHRGNEPWYIASGVKVPVALAVLQQVDQGALSLDTTLSLSRSDYLDGAGETNLQKPGSRLTVQYLLEQMLIHSDNTASDLLIRQVGIDQVNRSVRRLVPEGFSEITTLADVRRRAYGGFDPKGRALTNADFMTLKAISDEGERLKKLGQLLGRKPGELHYGNFDAAYAAYYSSGVNTASLQAYGQLLEALSRGKVLSSESDRFLFRTMIKAQTGQRRLKAGFPPGFVFAHKTGTQRQRICDFGVLWQGAKPTGKRLVIAACTRGFLAPTKAENALREMGSAIHSSGVFSGR